MLLGTQDKDFFPEEIGEKLQFVKDFGLPSASRSTGSFWWRMWRR